MILRGLTMAGADAAAFVGAAAEPPHTVRSHSVVGRHLSPRLSADG